MTKEKCQDLNKRSMIDKPVNPLFIFMALPIAFFCVILSYIFVLFGLDKKRTIKEVTKVLSLLLLIGLSMYLIDNFQMTPGKAAAKVREIEEQGLNLTDNLTREEKDEYMLYLRELNDYDYENPKADTILKLKL